LPYVMATAAALRVSFSSPEIQPERRTSRASSGYVARTQRFISLPGDVVSKAIGLSMKVAVSSSKGSGSKFVTNGFAVTQYFAKMEAARARLHRVVRSHFMRRISMTTVLPLVIPLDLGSGAFRLRHEARNLVAMYFMKNAERPKSTPGAAEPGLE